MHLITRRRASRRIFRAVRPEAQLPILYQRQEESGVRSALRKARMNQVLLIQSVEADVRKVSGPMISGAGKRFVVSVARILVAAKGRALSHEETDRRLPEGVPTVVEPCTNGLPRRLLRSPAQLEQLLWS